MYRKNKEITDYTCFDIETTGFGKNAEIIEIGAVKIRSKTIISKFDELIKPTYPIPKAITKLTGISQEDVENCRSIGEVLPEFLDFIEDDILVGHNIATFDIPQLRRAIAVNLNQNFEKYYIDTKYMSEEIHGVENHRQQTMLDYYGIKNDCAHRAYQDSEANYKLLNALIADGITPKVRFSCSCVPLSELATATVETKEEIEIEFSDCPESFAGKRIVITGDFIFGTREEVENALISAKAVISAAVNKKTDYVIVGCCGSSRWTYENGGRKIKTAKEIGVKILKESDVPIFGKTEEKMSEQITLFGSQTAAELTENLKEIVAKARKKYGYEKMHISGMYEAISSAPSSELYEIIEIREQKDKSAALYFDNQLYIKFIIKKPVVNVSKDIYEAVLNGIPAEKIGENGSPKGGYAVNMEYEKQIELLEKAIEYLVKTVKPAHKFSCCDLYKKCSEAGKCLHENRYYAKGCQYLRNLEQGVIFYKG